MLSFSDLSVAASWRTVRQATFALGLGLPRGGLQAEHPRVRFAGGAGMVLVQPVHAGPGVGVNQGDACLFLHEVAHGGQQGDVFEHIRMVAGVESVSITEHAPMVTNKLPKNCPASP